MSYNDGWRVYEDIPEKIEKRSILMLAKRQLEKQLEKQQEKVRKVSENTRKLTLDNSTQRRRAIANMRLSEECNFRDIIQRRLDICEEMINEVEK